MPFSRLPKLRLQLTAFHLLLMGTGVLLLATLFFGSMPAELGHLVRGLLVWDAWQTVVYWIKYVGNFLAVLSLIVFFHELGHWGWAQRKGLPTPVFNIGFGPSICLFVWRGTQWRLGILPFGGYVKIPALDEILTGNTSIILRVLGTALEGDLVTLTFSNYLLPGGKYTLSYRMPSKTIPEKLAISLEVAINADATLKAAGITCAPQLHEEMLKLRAQSLPKGKTPKRSPRPPMSPMFSPVCTLKCTTIQTRLNANIAGTSPDARLIAQPVTAWTKLGVIVAGPIVNLYPLPWMVAFVALLYYGQAVNDVHATYVTGVSDGSPSAVGGFTPGDEFVSIDGQKIITPDDLTAQLEVKKGKEIQVIVRRPNSPGEASVTAKEPEGDISTSQKGVADARCSGAFQCLTRKVTPDQSSGKIGVQFDTKADHIYRPVSPSQAVILAAQQTNNLIVTSATGIGWMTGLVKPPPSVTPNMLRMTGPIGIASMVNQAVDQGGAHLLLSMIMVLSVAVGLTNLVPYPILDGGYVVLIIYRLTAGRWFFAPLFGFLKPWVKPVIRACAHGFLHGLGKMRKACGGFPDWDHLIFAAFTLALVADANYFCAAFIGDKIDRFLFELVALEILAVIVFPNRRRLRKLCNWLVAEVTDPVVHEQSKQGFFPMLWTYIGLAGLLYLMISTGFGDHLHPTHLSSSLW